MSWHRHSPKFVHAARLTTAHVHVGRLCTLNVSAQPPYRQVRIGPQYHRQSPRWSKVQWQASGFRKSNRSRRRSTPDAALGRRLGGRRANKRNRQVTVSDLVEDAGKVPDQAQACDKRRSRQSFHRRRQNPSRSIASSSFRTARRVSRFRLLQTLLSSCSNKRPAPRRRHSTFSGLTSARSDRLLSRQTVDSWPRLQLIES